MIELICEWGIPVDLDTAQRQAQAAASIGAAWSKWQMLDPARLASADAKRYWDAKLGGSESQRETFEAAGGLDEVEWAKLGRYCKTVGVSMLVTPFDLEAVELLEVLDVEAYKISSGDITYRPLYEKVAQTGKRVFFSTGAASLGEIRSARAWLRRSPAVALACDLIYPCPAKQTDFVRQLKQLRGVTSILGYSDHTRELATGAMAVAHGARALEKHVTLTPHGDRPDDRMALTVSEAKRYLELADEAAALCDRPVGEDQQARARLGARRSAYATRDLEAGTVLKASDIIWLRPAPPDAIKPTQRLAGRTLAHPVGAGDRIEREALV